VSFERAEKCGQRYGRFLALKLTSFLSHSASSVGGTLPVLRKIRRSEQVGYADELLPKMGEKFHMAYCKLAKGRQSYVVRWYWLMYYSVFTAMDVLVNATDYVPGMFVSPSAWVQTSDAIIAFRLLIYVGSFAILGAYPVTDSIGTSAWIITENVCIAGLAFMYCTSLFVFGKGWCVIPEPVRRGLVYLRGFLFVLTVILAVVWCYSSIKGTTSHVADVANALLEGKEPKDMTEGQRERFKYMGGEEVTQERFRLPIRRLGTAAGSVAPTGPGEWFSALVWLFLYATNGMAWGAYNRDGSQTKEFASTVLLEPLELISVLLIAINSTQVEPELFRVLAQAEKGETSP
jgi:hypothetical protein